MASILQLTTGQVYLVSGTFTAANGTSSAPGVTFAGNAFDGFYWVSTGHVGFTSNGNNTIDFGTGVTVSSAATFGWAPSTTASAGPDTMLVRDGAANTIAQKNGNTDQHWREYGMNGGYWEFGTISELLTLSTGGATTDTTTNLLPVNSIIEAVVARVTTTITVATDWKLGDATISGRFSAANSVMTAGSTTIGTVCADQTGTSGPRQVAAAKLRVTTTGTPGAGVIRITTFYRQFVAQTS